MESNQPSQPSSIRPLKSLGVYGSNPWLYPLLVSFLLAILFNVRLVNDADLGFHLKSGQWILENHQVPSTDTYTYTATGRDYLDMEWLYQIALYGGFKMGGYTLLSITHGLLALLAFGLLWIRLEKTEAPSALAVLVFAVALLACEPRFRVRPEILTWVLLSLELWILESRVNRTRDLLFLLPFIQLLWVNTEGLFFIGWAVLGAYCLSSLIHSPKTDAKLLRYSLAAFGICLLNPYFFRGLLFPFTFLTSLDSSEIFRYAVNEFQRPWSYHTPPHSPVPLYLWFYKGFSLCFLAGLLATFKKRKTHEWILALFFFALSFSAVRNIPLFLLACAPLAGACWSEILKPFLQKHPTPSLYKSIAALALSLCLLGFCARVVTNAHYVSSRLSDRFGLGLDRKNQPVRACDFLLENHLDGKIINDLDSGDWLDWRGPQKTFIDGRLDVMGTDFFSQYSKSQLPGGIAGLAAQYKPDIFFFNPLQMSQWAMDFRQMPDWRLVYLDSDTAIYLRKGYADQVRSLDYGKWFTENGLSQSILSQAPQLLELAQPSAWRLWVGDFFHPCHYPNDLMNLGIFCGYTGNVAASEICFLEAIRQTGGRYYDFYYNLGLLYNYVGKSPEAILCMNRVLKEKPSDPLARQISGLPPIP